MKNLLLILIGALATFEVDAQAQTIADIARRERERQSGLESKAVFTSETLKASTVTPNPIETTSVDPSELPPPAGTAAAPDKPVGPTDNKGRDEKWWRSAFADARAELTRAENKVSLTQLRINQLNGELLMNSAMYNRENRLGPALNAAKAELDGAIADVETAKKTISDLETELRVSGGLPGWAR